MTLRSAWSDFVALLGRLLEDPRDAIGVVGLALAADGGRRLSLPWTEVIIGGALVAFAIFPTILLLVRGISTVRRRG